MKNVPLISVLLFAIFVILAVWENVQIYNLRKDQLREIWNRRCVCNAQVVNNSTNLTFTIMGGGGTAGPATVTIHDSGSTATNTAP